MITVPDAFRKFNQFIIWKEFPSRAPGSKPLKVPIYPPIDNYTKINPHDPMYHMTADQALTYVNDDPALGVGFVLTADDPFFLLDIDDALQVGGQWSDLANSLYDAFKGCYYELSHNGKGFHILGTGSYPDHGCRNDAYGIEFYTQDRFIALTGTNSHGSADCAPQATVEWLVNSYFGTRPPVTQADWTDEPCPEWCGIDDDKVLIDKMCNSKSVSAAFKNKASFNDLWQGTTDHYGGDHSSADAALCSHLAFWTGKDCARMDNLFRKSGLMREKWDRPTAGSTYGKITIVKSVGLCKKVFGEGVDPDNNPGSMRGGFQLLTVDKQREYFKDCTYVSHQNRILTPSGTLLDCARFKAVYGGYTFVLGNDYDSKTTPDAWKAFTENQGFNFPKVVHTCFRPDLAPNEITTDDVGHTEVNTYLPAIIESVPGDAKPFVDHVKKMLPDDKDRAILLAYLAACVQHIGTKFQWAPLVQGVQGNGKSMISNCVARAVGLRYTHKPNATDITNKFNSWLENKLLIIIEEMTVSEKWDTMEILKTMITETSIDIQAKGADQRLARVCANFIMNSNRKDSLVKTIKDRRHCIFFTAQQDPYDLVKDGMDGDYFPKLYKWLNTGGYAVVAHYLQNYKIPAALNPATECHRAPVTTSTSEAIQTSLTLREQEIQNAVLEGAEGFRGGWVSSVRLRRLLSDKGLRIAPNKVQSLMSDLGYIQHPGLDGGRVSAVMLTEENKKPRLYVKDGHLSAQLTGAQVMRSYLTAQSESPTATTHAFRQEAV